VSLIAGWPLGANSFSTKQFLNSPQWPQGCIVKAEDEINFLGRIKINGK
jgi:hypothetical protein